MICNICSNIYFHLGVQSIFRFMTGTGLEALPIFVMLVNVWKYGSDSFYWLNCWIGLVIGSISVVWIHLEGLRWLTGKMDCPNQSEKRCPDWPEMSWEQSETHAQGSCSQPQLLSAFYSLLGLDCISNRLNIIALKSTGPFGLYSALL